VIKSLTN